MLVLDNVCYMLKKFSCKSNLDLAFEDDRTLHAFSMIIERTQSRWCKGYIYFFALKSWTLYIHIKERGKQMLQGSF